MKFVKMHGTGNDFVLLRARGDEQDWSRLAQAMCDRHYGIGADGLLLVLPSSQADVRMRMFNPDGSEAEMCGNGLRCVAKYAVDEGLAPPRGGRISVETAVGVLAAQVFGEKGAVERVRVSLGVPRFAPQEIPVLAEGEPPVKDLPLDIEGERLAVTCVSLGNPHAVHFAERPVAEFPLEDIGPKVEHHPLFPQRTNFGVARVLDRERMEARVWERGTGITLACGSGACAAVVAAQLHGLVGERVDITLPGGVLRVEWDGAGECYLAGPAETVFVGGWRK
ncbi:MAG: diaminopimelate epimerase [Dehalococcoidia bacterium]|nr:MAG: diaminopimelate epimerase [Dehalococcoidia bacterium]